MTGKLFTVQEAADLLRLHPRTVMNMARRGDIPGSKIGKQWRFDSAALESWLTLRMGNPEPSHPLALAPSPLPKSLFDLVDCSTIRRVERLANRVEVLEELALLLERNENLPDYRSVLDLLKEREEMVSTAVGGGIAFPHPRHPLASLTEPALATLVVRQGVDYGSPDGKPTYVFMGICSHNDASHVRILAKLVHIFRDPENVEEVRSGRTPEEILEGMHRAEIRSQSGNGQTRL